jgi:hypothetical protein
MLRRPLLRGRDLAAVVVDEHGVRGLRREEAEVDQLVEEAFVGSRGGRSGRQKAGGQCQDLLFHFHSLGVYVFSRKIKKPEGRTRDVRSPGCPNSVRAWMLLDQSRGLQVLSKGYGIIIIIPGS